MSEENPEIVGFDFETYYDSEYSLSNMSVFNYVNDPRFDCYMLTVHDKTGPVYAGRPEGFDWSIADNKIAAAHNMSFDYVVLARLVELGKVPRMPKAKEFVCTADLAAWLGVKRDLKTAAKYLLGLEISKAVRAAMKGKVSADLADNADVLKYAGDDAKHCYEIAAKCLCDWPAEEREISRLNREAGIRGIHMDVDMVETGIATLEPQLQAAMDKIPWVATGDKPLSPNALRRYGQALGLSVPASLAKDSPDFVEWSAKYAEQYPWVKAVGEYRSINALLCKVKSIRDGIDPATGMFPFGIRYMGAATGRFSGGSSGESGGKVNMQNLPSRSMYGVEVRPMFKARDGYVFIVADYSQVEARALLWLAGDTEALVPVHKGLSVYQAQAETLGLAEPGSNISETNKPLYKYVKACTLGLGYQTAAPKFKEFAKTYGVELTIGEAEDAVADWRRKNWRIVQFWRGHQDSLCFSARRKDDTHQIEFRSGRILTFWEPRMQGREISVYQTRGTNRTFLYGGKCTENETQGTCRDILCDAWRAIDKAGLPPVTLTVHDEIVMEARRDEAPQIAKEVERLMISSSPWAEGLPLGAKVGIAERYEK